MENTFSGKGQGLSATTPDQGFPGQSHHGKVHHIGYEPFKLSVGELAAKDLRHPSDQHKMISIDARIPDFLKYAVPMEQLIPSMESARRMDIVLPGYSKTTYVNQHKWK